MILARITELSVHDYFQYLRAADRAYALWQLAVSDCTVLAHFYPLPYKAVKSPQVHVGIELP